MKTTASEIMILLENYKLIFLAVKSVFYIMLFANMVSCALKVTTLIAQWALVLDSFVNDFDVLGQSSFPQKRHTAKITIVRLVAEMVIQVGYEIRFFTVLIRTEGTFIADVIVNVQVNLQF